MRNKFYYIEIFDSKHEYIVANSLSATNKISNFNQRSIKRKLNIDFGCASLFISHVFKYVKHRRYIIVVLFNFLRHLLLKKFLVCISNVS